MEEDRGEIRAKIIEFFLSSKTRKNR